MKRALLLTLALLPILCACNHKESTPDIGTVSETILSCLEEKQAFILADDDFEESNFNLDEQTDEARIYIDEGREIGIFQLESDGDATLVERRIRDYIASEKESISSLLELYPSEELSARLARYENSAVLRKNGYVCYLILGKDELSAAEQAFLQLF